MFNKFNSQIFTKFNSQNVKKHFVNASKIFSVGLGIFTSYVTYEIISTKYLINQIENEHDSKLILVSNRDDNDQRKYGIIPYVRNNFLHYVFKNNMIDINNDEKFKKILNKHSTSTIQLIVKSYGGNAVCSTNILNILKHHPAKVETYVPAYALSAASLLVLSSSQIYMNNHATLSPTDPQSKIYTNNESLYLNNKLLEKFYADIDPENIKVLKTLYENQIFYLENEKMIKEYLLKHKKNDVSEENLEELFKIFIGEGYLHTFEVSSNYLKDYINITIGVPKDIQNVYDKLESLFDGL